MHIRLLLKQFDDIAQRGFGLHMVRPHGGRGHHIDCRGKLVVNPMGQLADENPFIEVGRTRHGGIVHDDLLNTLHRIFHIACIYVHAMSTRNRMRLELIAPS